jgi:hypothetical protein
VYQNDYWEGYEPWDALHVPPVPNLAEEAVGGSAYCNRCQQLAVPLFKLDGQVGGAYWRGTGRWDQWLNSGERVVCVDCIVTSEEWEQRYPWFPLVLYIVALGLP